jgi:LytS/YehU family sensor histidine kinase
MHISVENPFDAEGAAASRNGLGLQIVKRRLLARYGDRADMAAESGEKRYRVEILLPYETG